MLARAHSLARSVVGPGSSTRSQSPSRRTVRMISVRAGPSPKIRSRHPGSRSAMRAKAETSCGYCFSPPRRPAATISGSSSRERGRKPGGIALGTTTRGGVASPSRCRSQSASASTSRATTSARGAEVRSGSSPAFRCDDARCSWCTSAMDGGRSCAASASNAGVTVTSTSAVTVGRTAWTATSPRASRVGSHSGRTSRRDSSAGSSGSSSRVSTRSRTTTPGANEKAGPSLGR